MSRMIVHGVPGSPYVRAALLTLEEKDAEYELAAMALGTLKQEPHLSRHPFGRIPAFEHDGWMLYETQAIMRYVDAVAPGPRLQPEEPRAAARMNQVMGITDWYLMPQVSRTITANRVVKPRFNLPVDEDAVVKAIPDARHCLSEIGRLLDGHTWMAGEAIQALGGVGYTNEFPTGRLWRDAKLYEIGAGTSEVRRMLIGRELMAETA